MKDVNIFDQNLDQVNKRTENLSTSETYKLRKSFVYKNCCLLIESSLYFKIVSSQLRLTIIVLNIMQMYCLTFFIIVHLAKLTSLWLLP